MKPADPVRDRRDGGVRLGVRQTELLEQLVPKRRHALKGARFGGASVGVAVRRAANRGERNRIGSPASIGLVFLRNDRAGYARSGSQKCGPCARNAR